MGACQSMLEGEPDDTGADFKEEFNAERMHANKITGEIEAFDPADNDKPNDDFFEFDDFEIDETDEL